MAECKVSEYYKPQPTEDSGETAKKSGGSLAIKQWAEDDRPREKLLAHGAEALSTAELFAILIGSGSVNESAVELMRRVMHDCGNSLRRLSQLTIADLMQYKGIGMAKAVTLMAASELGRRRREEQHKDKLLIFLSHAAGSSPRGSAAVGVMYDATLKIWVEGYKAFSKGRFIGPTGEYTIWDEGAARYWGYKNKSMEE